MFPRRPQTILNGSRCEIERAKLIFLELPKPHPNSITPPLKAKCRFPSVADREYHVCLSLPDDTMPIAGVDGRRRKRKPRMAVPFANPVHLSARFTPPPKRSEPVPQRRALKAGRILPIPCQWTGDLSHMKVWAFAQSKYQPARFQRSILPGTFQHCLCRYMIDENALDHDLFLTRHGHLIEQLVYDPIDERYAADIFTAAEIGQDFSQATERLKNHVFDYCITDYGVERDFVGELDTSAEVEVYAKLPRGFLIPTPVGDYNPDWAIVFRAGAVKHIYFVAETKGAMSSFALRDLERAKIDCAKKFFAS